MKRLNGHIFSKRTPSPGGKQVAGVDGSTERGGSTAQADLRRDSTGDDWVAGRRGSGEGGPPTPSAAAKLHLAPPLPRTPETPVLRFVPRGQAACENCSALYDPHDEGQDPSEWRLALCERCWRMCCCLEAA